MSSEDNKKVMLKWMNAWNQHDILLMEKLADEVFSADVIMHDPGFPDTERGTGGVKEFVRRIMTNAPDTRITVQDLFAEGDKVAIRFTVSSTNTATGKLESMQLLDISHFVNGKIAEEWEIGVAGSW